jgi:hypothetical protein
MYPVNYLKLFVTLFVSVFLALLLAGTVFKLWIRHDAEMVMQEEQVKKDAIAASAAAELERQIKIQQENAEKQRVEGERQSQIAQQKMLEQQATAEKQRIESERQKLVEEQNTIEQQKIRKINQDTCTYWNAVLEKESTTYNIRMRDEACQRAAKY